MLFEVSRSRLSGEIMIPGSKSHTIRAAVIATLAGGKSTLRNALLSADTRSCFDACQKMGAKVTIGKDCVEVEGLGGIPTHPHARIDVGNSGTSLRIITAIAALGATPVEFDGDNSIRGRLMTPLFDGLAPLGANITSTNGKCPFTISGPIHGGKTRINGISSQFLTALLMAAPMCAEDIEIEVDNLNEKPYVEITLDWLNKMGIRYEHKGLDWFKIKGGQQYKAFDLPIAADFSSATFPLCAAAITGSELLIKGLDFSDFQGDKIVFEHFGKMGVKIEHRPEGILVKGGELRGIDIDMNAIPDALPAMAVAGCFASGTTRLLNVPQARLKECDRIAASAKELTKMGARIEELPDGLVIHQSSLQGTSVHGYDDHRMVMALSLAAMAADGLTQIDTAEAVDVTFPTFAEDFKRLGAKIKEL